MICAVGAQGYATPNYCLLVRSPFAMNNGYFITHDNNLSMVPLGLGLTPTLNPPQTMLARNHPLSALSNSMLMQASVWLMLTWVLVGALGEQLVNSCLLDLKDVRVFLHLWRGEALGLLYALKWVGELNFQQVIVESDCKVIVDKLQQDNFDHTELGVILKECRHVLDLFPFFRVVFVSRKANTVAHVLASKGLSMDVTQTYHLPPPYIVETIMNEML